VIRAFALQADRLVAVPVDDPADPGILWFDLFEPTHDEETGLERRLALDLPTRDEMQEIELSSRLYSEGGAHFMTAMVLSHTDGDDVVVAPITFILAQHRLITIRYTAPRTFDVYPQRAGKAALGACDGETVLLGLLETIVDRAADILERAGRDIDLLSRRVFGHRGSESRKAGNYKATLEEIGRKGDLTSNIRDSLVTLERLAAYLSSRQAHAEKDVREALSALSSDIRSLSDHADFMASKITFLLDATLGLIGIEQNAIIKIFSVAAVIFLPPTLVASIYGMNFDHMPELSWPWGYPFAIGLMIVSAILPFLYFKRRGWL